MDTELSYKKHEPLTLVLTIAGLEIETISSSNSVPAGFSQADTKNYKKIAAKPRRKNKF